MTCAPTCFQVVAGVGGVEAALFAAELFDMYTRLARRRGWRFDPHQTPEAASGGRDFGASISGEGVHGALSVESGTHRVQRVPTTEALGRVHTSTAVVVVLPEADEASVDLNEADVVVEAFRAGGAGGQHVNTTESAVRLTHKPTGLKVSCQNERSQHMNRASAFKVLRARLAAYEAERQQNERQIMRSEQAGTGSRSERIRTYNFPDDRVTDHRLGVSKFGMARMMSGEALEELLIELGENRRRQRLESFLQEFVQGGKAV